MNLDAAATAPLRPEARAAMTEVLDAGQANASSVHSAGHRARAVLSGAREAIAGAMRARPSEIIFTSGGTEANNLAVIGLALANPRGRHLVISPIEHPSVLESGRYLERVFGFDVTEVPVDTHGRVDPLAVAAVLRPDTTLVSVGLANGEIGTVQRIGEIADAAHAVGALTVSYTHLDVYKRQLLSDAGVVVGAVLRDAAGELSAVRADAVVLATGGYAALYPETSNHAGARGEGIVLAARIGAAVADLEFVQFHPTVLAGTGMLISEALRGAGAVLRDESGARFMTAAHAAAELAPRDVVSREVHRSMRASGAAQVWLCLLYTSRCV